MILRAEDPHQVFFTSRWEIVQDEELVRTVDEVVNQLDLGPRYACWREGGRGFYDPGMLLKLLFFGYCDGERYSRKIAKRIKYDIRYQYFAGSRRPSYRSICRFRNIDVGLLAHYWCPAHQAQSLKTALVTSINPLFRSVASGVRKLFAQNHLVHRKLEFMYQK